MKTTQQINRRSTVIIAVLLYTVVSFFFVGKNSAFAQDYMRHIGVSGTDESGASIVKGPSGDYFIGGYSGTAGIVSRLSPEGEVIWMKSLDFGDDPDYLLELTITSDNFLIGCGNARTGGSFNPYGFIFKMDLSGTLIWSRVFVCDDLYLWANNVYEASNGNYRVTGSFKNTRLDNYVVEYDAASGIQVWDSVYAHLNIDNTWDESYYDGVVHPTNDADYFGGRFQLGAGMGSYRPSLTKIGEDGAFEWSKTYLYNSSPSGGRYYCFGVDYDGDSLIMGLFCKDGGTGAPFETGLIKTDLDGNIGWAKLYSSPGKDLRTYNTITVPGGYMLCGWKEGGDESIFLIRTNMVGEVLWSKMYGADGDEDAYMFSSNGRVMIDGDYVVVTGRTNSFTPDFDALLVKADFETGEMESGGCYEDLAIVQESLPAYQQDYSMVVESLPIISSDPDILMTDIEIPESGLLVETETDTAIGGDTIVMCGGAVEVLADWNPDLDFLWSTGETTNSITISETGTFWVDVSVGGGCLVFTDTVTVYVDSLLFDLGPDTSFCEDETLVLDPGYFEGAVYEWQDGALEETFTVDESGLYWVTVTSGLCSHTDSIMVTILDSVVVNLGMDTTLCAGDEFLLDAGNPGASFEWNDGSTDETLLVTGPGTYWVEVSAGDCFSSDTINIEYIEVVVELGNDTILCEETGFILDAGFVLDAIYEWQDGSSEQIFTALESGLYWVHVTSGVCSFTDSINITFLDPVEVNLGMDTVLCEGEELLLNAGNPDAIYEWNDASTNQTLLVTGAGLYWVEVNVSGCLNSDNINIEYIDLGVDLGNDTVLCEGATLLLNAGLIPGVDYEWNDGTTSPTLLVNTAGNYSVDVNNGICDATDDINIFYANPVCNFTADPITGCTPLTVQFTDLSSTDFGAIVSWFWSFGDGNTSTLANPTHTYMETGVYTVSLMVTTTDGCSDMASYTEYISVGSSTVANFAFSPSLISTQSTVEFSNLSTNGTSWYWDFGDGTNSSLQDPNHVYDKPGTYTITLIAFNENGCNDTITKQLIVKDDVLIYIPNVFTPDGDDFNEVWKVYFYGIDIYDFHLLVFDRWGEIIFESYDSSVGWSGTYGGKLVMDGIYVYQVEFGDKWTDERSTIRGHVTVLK